MPQTNTKNTMKKSSIAIASVASLLILVPTFNITRSYLAASFIYQDYRACRSYPSLAGGEDIFAFARNATEPEKQTEKYQQNIATARRITASCDKYYQYWREWGDKELPVSEEFLWFLISRYEPERLK